MRTNTIRPRISCQRYGRINPNRVRVFKDVYSYPNWHVYLGTLWVGSAHNEIVAQDGAKLTALHASIIAYAADQNSAQKLIEAVTISMASMGHSTHWMAGFVHIDHKNIIHKVTPWNSRTDGRDKWPKN